MVNLINSLVWSVTRYINDGDTRINGDFTEGNIACIIAAYIDIARESGDGFFLMPYKDGDHLGSHGVRVHKDGTVEVLAV